MSNVQLMLAQKLPAGERLAAAIAVRDAEELWLPDKPRFLVDWAADSIARSLKAIKNHSSALPVLIPGYWRFLASGLSAAPTGFSLNSALPDAVTAALTYTPARPDGSPDPSGDTDSLREAVCTAVVPLLRDGSSFCRIKLEGCTRLLVALGALCEKELPVAELAAQTALTRFSQLVIHEQ